MDIVVLSISILTSYFAHKIHLWLCVLIDIQPRTISTHHYAWSDSCSCILSGTVMIRQVCAAFGTSKVSQQSAAGFCDFMFQYWIHTPGNSSHRITGTFVISSIFNLIWGTFAHGDFLPLAQGHTFPLGSSFSGDFIPDSPSQNCLSAVVLNTRMGKQVTWLGTTASSTTPADNVFLQLLAFFFFFHIFTEYLCIRLLCARWGWHLGSKEKCVIISVSPSLSDELVKIVFLLLLKADLITICIYTGQYWDSQVVVICSVWHDDDDDAYNISKRDRLFILNLEWNVHCIDIAYVKHA